jgi:ribosomal protein S4E
MSFMTRFSEGEQVIIRYGRHQGQKATVVKSQTKDAYRVKVEDGTVLFFTSKGLEKEKERVQKAVS